MKMAGLVASAVLAGLMLAMASTGVLAQDRGPHGGARTYYESLDMGTAEASAEGFVSAYRRGDYQTVYFYLSPAAQEGFSEAFSTFAFDRLFDGLDRLDLPGSKFMSYDDGHAEEVIYDMSLVFDDFIYAGDRLGKLAFAIEADAVPAPVSGDGEKARFAIAQTATEPELLLDMVRIASGRWKLDRVSWQGSGPARPWDSGQGVSTPAP